MRFDELRVNPALTSSSRMSAIFVPFDVIDMYRSESQDIFVFAFEFYILVSI